jgi:hypothetical protein
MKLLSSLLMCICCIHGFSQGIVKDSTYKQVSDKTLDKLSQSYAGLDKSINQQSNDIVDRFQKQELKLRNMLQKKDSSAAQQLFSNSEATFQMLKSKLQQPLSTNTISSLKNYVPGLDSVKTALQFLNKSGLSIAGNQRATALIGQINQLQASFQNANSIKEYLSQREANLQQDLSQFGLSNKLAGLNKQVFYYQQELSQYKEILNDQQKQQQAILSVIKTIPAFQKFWQNNSTLSQLFPMPGNTGTVLAGVGLQTSIQVGKNIQQRLGTNMDDGEANASQFMQQQIGGAGQTQMDQLKDKLDKLNLGSGNSEMTLPDFAPAYTNRKSFFDRLELGFNIQNNNSTNFLPTITNLGLSLGYKLSKNATIGFGVSYLLGLGAGINHIRLSNQGIGFQNFVNIKIKGSIWLTGGFEYNYMQQFSSISSIKNLELWQKSALMGLMKKYNVGKKSGNIQLLYDFLAAREVPQSQPLKIRFGFNLN